MTRKKAFLFDLNGTMIDDMKFHIEAWHKILIGLGADITNGRVREECYGKNDEMLERIFPNKFSTSEKRKLGDDKESQYRLQFKPNLRLIEGLGNFIKEAHDSGIKMAIGSAAIMPNIDFVLDGLNLRQYFDVIVSADDVAYSKPHPETFVTCCKQLGISSSECIVFEDAPKGVEAARNAEIDCIVITTLHSREEFKQYSNVIHCIEDYNDAYLKSFLVPQVNDGAKRSN